MLYVSFWKIALANLPIGMFTHKLVTPSEAAELISSARRMGKLLGVSQDDLAAPYQRRARLDHKRMCEALKAHDVELTVEDFFGSTFINPLNFAHVDEGKRLLVIDASFTWVGMQDRPTRTSSRLEISDTEKLDEAISRHFELAPDTITFHLIESSGAT